MTQELHRATFQCAGQVVTLTMLRTNGHFIVRVSALGRHVDSVCVNAADAETVYCRLFSQGTTGHDLAPALPDPQAYMVR